MEGSTGDKQAHFAKLQKLNYVLQHRPELFRDEPPLPRAAGAMAQLTGRVSSANKSDYRMNRHALGVGNQLAAILNQADVERQWRMLRYNEMQLEKSNELRAAFNYYTQQLQFDGDAFLLRASPKAMKEMVRNDALPSLTAVITSDLDLRDLYRNQFLTSVDDLIAEVFYQVKQSSDSVELDDVCELMEQSLLSIDNWFGLIDSKEVSNAMAIAEQEQSL